MSVGPVQHTTDASVQLASIDLKKVANGIKKVRDQIQEANRELLNILAELKKLPTSDPHMGDEINDLIASVEDMQERTDELYRDIGEGKRKFSQIKNKLDQPRLPQGRSPSENQDAFAGKKRKEGGRKGNGVDSIGDRQHSAPAPSSSTGTTTGSSIRPHNRGSQPESPESARPYLVELNDDE